LSAIHTLLQKIVPKINRKARKQDNSAGNGAQELSARRAAIIDALNKSIEIFSTNKEDTFDEVMTSGIRPIADAAGLDRVAFYALVNRDGKKRLGQIYRWDRQKGGLMYLADELRILPDIPVLENWISITSQGGCIRLRENDYSENEAAFFRVYGIKSILLLPIFTHGEFWGGVTFQDHANDRYFDEGCADLLYSAARIFSNAIIRAEMNRAADKTLEALKRREKMSNTLNRVSIMFLAHGEKSFEDTMSAGIGKIADELGLDRFSIWRNFSVSEPQQNLNGEGSYIDVTHVSQIYRWDREAGGTTLSTEGFEDVTYARFAPRWEKLLASDETINSPVGLLPEAAMLKSFGCVSVFVTPLFINNFFWGFALLEDRHIERFFEEDCIEMMRSAAFLCANIFIRADMEREIANANEFTRAVLDASPLGFTVFDDNARVIDCNDFTLKVLVTTKKYYKEHFYEFSPEYQVDGEKSADKAFELVKRALDGENLVFEWIHRNSLGELLPFEVTLTRTKYNGRYIVMGYQYDMRFIKTMTDNIREQGEQLKIKLNQQELISEISRGFISSGDSDTLVREAIAKIGKYHKVSLVFIFSVDYENKNTNLAYHWYADGEPPRQSISNLFEYIKTIFSETLPECATMTILPCDNTAVNPDPIFQALYSVGVMAIIAAPIYVEGRLWGVISVEQNSTPRTWTRNEKDFVGMTASTIAGVIMRDIYTIKLKEALYKATEASKAKSEFLSNMSHEMRTPLNAITGMTSIGRNANNIERKDYALDKIGDASTHLLGVINDVLDMSKIEANMLELSPIEFNFEKMLQKVVTVINFRVDEKHQKLTVRIDNTIPKNLIADDQRLAQVITNLLGNAVKFTPEKGLITLQALLLSERNGICNIQVSVSDTGIGISDEQQKHLFNSFQQAESSTTRKYGGTGLGLAISKSIVEMMGGRIWIESELGKGSSFIFTIQAQCGTMDKKGLLSSDVNLGNVRVIAIDDDPDVLTFFRDTIQGFGVSCETAISGKDALAMLEQKDGYHIYFVDWKMPGMDGIQLAREIKARTPGDSVVIMISAAELSGIAEEAKEAGVKKFLSKPLFPSTIAEVINECLGADTNQKEEVQTDITGIFKGHCILLAEDVEINREIVQTLLEPTQLEIDCAENGAKAVRMFTETPEKYEMILMDVQMPEMDGYEATQRIRAIETELIKKEIDDTSSSEGETQNINKKSLKQIPIIAMTANVFKEDIEKCIEAGMDGHIGKPLDFDEVLEKLRTYLS
jgi:signal transduction histidine kinase/DNA-binding response OmpR family regulator/PAS domain-containing protein